MVDYSKWDSLVDSDEEEALETTVRVTAGASPSGRARPHITVDVVSDPN